jgi:hypothetical protein
MISATTVGACGREIPELPIVLCSRRLSLGYENSTTAAREPTPPGAKPLDERKSPPWV